MAEAARPGLIVVAGPTASGKSALALKLALHFGGVLINADSMQIYRELNILSNRPGAGELARAPHRLFGVRSAAEGCSAASWRELALAEIETARRSRLLPIVVGGTGLYLRALLKGLARVPEIPPSVRAHARELHQTLGGPAFRDLLAQRDPQSARLNAGDRQRLIRAFEVLEATGKPLSHWQNEEGEPAAGDLGPVCTIVLDPPKPGLYARIDARFDEMMARGALAEARALAALGLSPDRPALKAVGVRELLAHLRGETTLEEAVKAAKTASRRYAKRQATWFRHQLPRNLVLTESAESQQKESFSNKIFSFIREFVLTGTSPAV